MENNITPPVCGAHNEQMVLNFYDRPGSPPGNGWVCRSCAKERKPVYLGNAGRGAEFVYPKEALVQPATPFSCARKLCA